MNIRRFAGQDWAASFHPALPNSIAPFDGRSLGASSSDIAKVSAWSSVQGLRLRTEQGWIDREWPGLAPFELFVVAMGRVQQYIELFRNYDGPHLNAKLVTGFNPVVPGSLAGELISLGVVTLRN